MKEFAKFLLLAQTASDAGKDFAPNKANSVHKAQRENYALKDVYIKQAIACSKRLGNVSISVSGDIGMNVVLFDIKGYGQVSFHSFHNFANYVKGYDLEWNGIRGGSIDTCRKLARKLKLPFYK